MNEFNALERRAGVLTIQGMQQTTIHTSMFMQALAAHQAGNEKLRELLRRTLSSGVAQGL